MSSLIRKFGCASAFAGIFFCSVAGSAWGAVSTSKTSITVTVTVTALGPHDAPAPAIPQSDVTAFSGSTPLRVTRWVRVRGNAAKLQLAVLIDNDLGPLFVGQEVEELKEFINSQPPTTSVGVFYAESGSAEAAIPFTTDHLAAANSVRLTLGRQGDSPSVYLSLSDLAKHWPSAGTTRREVVVIASGFDPLYPGIQDPYSGAAIDDMEKAGITVHSIMVPDARYAQTFRDNESEGKLIEVTRGTGGQVLFDGAFVPVSLAPPLNQLNKTLDNQYLLTFRIERNHKDKSEFRPLRVDTEEHDVKLTAPQQVLVSGTKRLPKDQRKEQPKLKLESRNGPVDMLAIDHVGPPSSN
jgi:hypothetical protein